MSGKKPKKDISITRSSAVEYLTFVAAGGEGGVEAVYADENVWLSQKMMATLYDVNVRTVNDHLKKIFADSELQEAAVIRKFWITARDGISSNRLARAFHFSLGRERVPSLRTVCCLGPLTVLTDSTRKWV